MVKAVLEMSSQLRKPLAKLTKPPSGLLVLLGNGNIAKGWRAKQETCTKQHREMLGLAFTLEMARKEAGPGATWEEK